MNISSKTWKWAAKHYRDFYNLTLQQARDWQTKSSKQADEIKALTAINAQLLDALVVARAWMSRDASPMLHEAIDMVDAAIRAEDEIANQKKVTTD